MKKINTKVNTRALKDFISKLLPIDKFIFMKVGQESVTSSVYLPEKDAVKLVSVPNQLIFDSLDVDEGIKIGFFNGTKIIEALNHFGDEVNATIKYEEIDGELMALDFVIFDKSLKISLACTDPSLSFMEMTKESLSKVFNADTKEFSFEILTEDTDRFKSLFNLEKDEELFEISADEGVHFKGKTFDNTLDCEFEGLGSVNLYKKYLNLLDKENYQVLVCSNKVIFKSSDTNTLLSVATAIIE